MQYFESFTNSARQLFTAQTEVALPTTSTLPKAAALKFDVQSVIFNSAYIQQRMKITNHFQYEIEFFNHTDFKIQINDIAPNLPVLQPELMYINGKKSKTIQLSKQDCKLIAYCLKGFTSLLCFDKIINNQLNRRFYIYTEELNSDDFSLISDETDLITKISDSILHKNHILPYFWIGVKDELAQDCVGNIAMLFHNLFAKDTSELMEKAKSTAHHCANFAYRIQI